MKNKVYILILSLFVSFSVKAEDIAAGESSSNLNEQPALNVKLEPIGGIKSYNDSGRLQQMNDKKAVHYSGKHEVSLGLKDKNSGWGAFAQYVQSVKTYGDSKKDKSSAGDPSLTLVHPDLYNQDGIKLSGQLREYFPVSDYSKTYNIYQQAYYLNLNANFAHRYSLYNQIVMRKFTQDNYKKDSSTWAAEDFSTYTKNLTPWFRMGVGQWTHLEWHYATGTGTSIEVFPAFEFLFGPKTFLSARIMLPVYLQNKVYDEPSVVSLQNAGAELYFQTSL